MVKDTFLWRGISMIFVHIGSVSHIGILLVKATASYINLPNVNIRAWQWRIWNMMYKISLISFFRGPWIKNSTKVLGRWISHQVVVILIALIRPSDSTGMLDDGLPWIPAFEGIYLGVTICSFGLTICCIQYNTIMLFANSIAVGERSLMD